MSDSLKGRPRTIGYAHDVPIPGSTTVSATDDAILSVRQRRAVDRDPKGTAGDAERHVSRESNRGDTGLCPHLLDEPLVEAAHLARVELDETGIEGGKQDAIAPESRVHMLRRDRSADHQTSADKDQYRNRDLQHDERATQRQPAGERLGRPA